MLHFLIEYISFKYCQKWSKLMLIFTVLQNIIQKVKVKVKMESNLTKNQNDALSNKPNNQNNDPDIVKVFGALFGYNKVAQYKPSPQQNVHNSNKGKLHEDIDMNCLAINRNHSKNSNSLNPGADVNGSNLRSSVGNWSFRQQNQSFKKGVSVYLNDSQFSQLNPNQEQNSKDNSCALSKEIVSVSERHSRSRSRSRQHSKNQANINNGKNQNSLNQKDQNLQELRQILLGSGLVQQGLQDNFNDLPQPNLENKFQNQNRNASNEQLNELKQILLGSNLMGSQVQQAILKNDKSSKNNNDKNSNIVKNKSQFNQKEQIIEVNKNSDNVESFIEQSRILTQKNYNYYDKNLSKSKKDGSQSDHFLEVDPNGLQNLLKKFDDLQEEQYQISIIQPVQSNCLNGQQIDNIQISHFQQVYINEVPEPNKQPKNESISVMKSSNQTKMKFYQSQKFILNKKDSKQSNFNHNNYNKSYKQQLKTQIRETNSQIIPIQQTKSHSPNKNLNDQISPLQFLTSIIQKSQKNYVVKINGINISQWGKNQKSQNQNQNQDLQKSRKSKKEDCITIQVTKNNRNNDQCKNGQNYYDEISSNVRNQCQKRRANRKYSLPQQCKEQVNLLDSTHTKKKDKSSKKKKKKSGEIKQNKGQSQHKKQQKRQQQRRQTVVFKKTTEKDIDINSPQIKFQQKKDHKKQQQASKIKFLIKKIRKLQKNIQLLTKLQQKDNELNENKLKNKKVQSTIDNFGDSNNSKIIKSKNFSKINFSQNFKQNRLSLSKATVQVQVLNNQRKISIIKNRNVELKNQNQYQDLNKIQTKKEESKILQQLVKMQQKIAFLQEKLNSQSQKQKERKSERYQQINSQKYARSNQNSSNKMYQTYFEEQKNHSSGDEYKDEENLSKQKSFKRSNANGAFISVNSNNNNFNEKTSNNKVQSFNKFQSQKNNNINKNVLEESPNRSAPKQPGRIIKKSEIQKFMTTNHDNKNSHDAISLFKNKLYFNQKNDSQTIIQSQKSSKKQQIDQPNYLLIQRQNEQVQLNKKNLNRFNFNYNFNFDQQQKSQSIQLKDNFLFRGNSDQFNNNNNRDFNKNSQNNSKNQLQESKRMRESGENMLEFNTEKQKYLIDSKETENQQLFNKSKSFQTSSVMSFQKLCQKSLPVIPNLPLPPTPQMSQENLIQLGRCIFQLFQVDKINDDQIVLNVKKYKNCVYFGIDSQSNILWHFEGKIYFGGWKSFNNGQGQKFGEGIQYSPKKYLYSGQFNYGKRNGQGVLRTFQPSSSIYIGQFVQGLKHGRGRLIEQNGLLYQGQWKNGKKHGAGMLMLSENQKYEGIFINGLKCGHGVQIFKNGDSYQGQYKDDKFQGKGFYQWHNESSYQGEFKNGKRNGYGIWKSALKNGDIYEGHYLNDLKQGFGIYRWPNGSSYQGAFKSDKKHGVGKTIYENGKISNLYWENGKVIKKISDQQEQKWDNNNFEQDFMKKSKKSDKRQKSIPKFQLQRQNIQKRTPSSSLHNFNTFNNNNPTMISGNKKGRIPSSGSAKWLNRQKISHKEQTQSNQRQQPKIAYRCKSSSNIRRLPKGDQLKQAQYRGIQSTINIAQF